MSEELKQVETLADLDALDTNTDTSQEDDNDKKDDKSIIDDNTDKKDDKSDDKSDDKKDDKADDFDKDDKDDKSDDSDKDDKNDKDDSLEPDLQALVDKAEKEGVEKLSDDEIKKLKDNDLIEDSTSNTDDSEVKEQLKTFQDDVEKLTGIKIDTSEVKEPINSPEGYANYLKQHGEASIARFEDMLERNFPVAYKALEVAIDGGDVMEYFKGNTSDNVDYTSIKLEDDNVDITQQKRIIKASLAQRGVEDSDIDNILKNSEDSNNLLSRAKKELGNLQEKQSQHREKYEKDLQGRKEQELGLMKTMSNQVQTIIDTGKIDNFIIPEADKSKFLTHVRKNIVYDNGKFLVVKEIEKDNLNNVLKQEFFNYRNGDITDLINKGANTKAALRLKSNIGKDKKKINSGGKEESSSHIPLGTI